MAITKDKRIGHIGVDELGTVTVRTDTVILEDDVEIARTHTRKIFEADVDVAAEPKRVRDICAAVRTPALVAAAVARKANIGG
jgi:hypothetical protein